MRVNAEINTINVENYLNILIYGFNHFLLLCGTHHSLHLCHCFIVHIIYFTDCRLTD